MHGETEVSEDDKEVYEIQWYRRKGFVSNLSVCKLLGAIYAVFALLPFLYFIYEGSIPLNQADHIFSKPWKVRALLFWAIIISIAYPLWAFKETSTFESWLLAEKQKRNRKPKIIEAEERNYFLAMQGQAKSFWAGVLAIYTIAGLWGAALRAIA